LGTEQQVQVLVLIRIRVSVCKRGMRNLSKDVNKQAKLCTIQRYRYPVPSYRTSMDRYRGQKARCGTYMLRYMCVWCVAPCLTMRYKCHMKSTIPLHTSPTPTTNFSPQSPSRWPPISLCIRVVTKTFSRKFIFSCFLWIYFWKFVIYFFLYCDIPVFSDFHIMFSFGYIFVFTRKKAFRSNSTLILFPTIVQFWGESNGPTR